MIKYINLFLIALLVLTGIAVPSFGWVILALVSILLFLTIALHIYVYCCIFGDGIKLSRILRQKDRVTTLDKAKEDVSRGLGTIIVEAPTPGWNVNRLWWCPDNVTESSIEFEKEPDAFVSEASENYVKYIAEDTGTAKLFDVFVITQRTEEYLVKHFGHFNFCFIPSALVRAHFKANKKDK